MILAISTSSPYATVAWFTGEQLVWRKVTESKRAASNAIISMIQESGHSIDEATGILVDIGPGSFTGVRVGLTLAKMWGELLSIPIHAVTTFDIIEPDKPVAIPSKKTEVYVRVPGEELTTMSLDQAKEQGFLIAGEADLQSLFSSLPPTEHIKLIAPLDLLPNYVSQPNISVAKQTHIMGETFIHGK